MESHANYLPPEGQGETPAPAPSQEKSVEATPPRSTRAALLRALAGAATDAADWEDKEEVARDKWCMMRFNGTQRLLLERLVRVTWKEMRDYHEFQSGAEIAAIVGVFDRRGYGDFNAIRDDLYTLRKSGIIGIQFKERTRIGIEMAPPAGYAINKPTGKKSNAALDGALETQPDGQKVWLDILASCQSPPNGGTKAQPSRQDAGTFSGQQNLSPPNNGTLAFEASLNPAAAVGVSPPSDGTKAIAFSEEESSSKLYSFNGNKFSRMDRREFKPAFLAMSKPVGGWTAALHDELLALIRAFCGGSIRTSQESGDKRDFTVQWAKRVREDPERVLHIWWELAAEELDSQKRHPLPGKLANWKWQQQPSA